MAKTDFKPVMVRNVVFSYPRLAATYKYNTAEKRSEECNPRAQGAAYSIGWEMSKADARKLHDELKAHYESCVTKVPCWFWQMPKAAMCGCPRARWRNKP